LYIDAHSEWKTRIKREVEALLKTFALPDTVPNPTNPTTSTIPAHPPRLHPLLCLGIHPTLPSLDLCLTETLRLTQSGTALRRAVTPDVRIGGRKVERGAFMAYLIRDVHLNSGVYEGPGAF
jgi:cytochrome P450